MNLINNYEGYYEKVGIFSQQNDEEDLMFLASMAAEVSHKGLRILDLGCAEGQLAVLLAKQGHDVTAADISKAFLERAKEHALQSAVNINLITCDIEDNISSLGNIRFDLVYFLDVLEHLRSPITALQNLRGLLSDDGVLVLRTPNTCYLGRFVSYLIRRKRLEDYYDPKNLGDLHLYGYDYKTLEKALNFVGLRVFELVPTSLRLTKSAKWPQLNPLFKFLSVQFPLLSNDLLVKCRKHSPIDIDALFSFWEQNRHASQIDTSYRE